MGYRRAPYLVTNSAGLGNASLSYGGTRRHLVVVAPAKRESTTVLPARATAKFSARPRLRDIRPLRLFFGVLLVAAIAVASAFAGGAFTHFIIGAYDIPRTHAAQVAQANSMSTPQSSWTAGTTPQVFQTDAQWASRPYGSGTLGSDGAAPACLTMALAKLSGGDAEGFVAVASWAQANGYAEGHALLTQGAEELGLAVTPVCADEMSLRAEINRGRPVICATAAGTFQVASSFVVIASIDEYGKLVVHDPLSAHNTDKHWTFDYVIDASESIWSYR